MSGMTGTSFSALTETLTRIFLLKVRTKINKNIPKSLLTFLITRKGTNKSNENSWEVDDPHISFRAVDADLRGMRRENPIERLGEKLEYPNPGFNRRCRSL